jgi:hypothetical protein
MAVAIIGAYFLSVSAMCWPVSTTALSIAVQRAAVSQQADSLAVALPTRT